MMHDWRPIHELLGKSPNGSISEGNAVGVETNGGRAAKAHAPGHIQVYRTSMEPSVRVFSQLKLPLPRGRQPQLARAVDRPPNAPYDLSSSPLSIVVQDASARLGAVPACNSLARWRAALSNNGRNPWPVTPQRSDQPNEHWLSWMSTLILDGRIGSHGLLPVASISCASFPCRATLVRFMSVFPGTSSERSMGDSIEDC